MRVAAINCVLFVGAAILSSAALATDEAQKIALQWGTVLQLGEKCAMSYSARMTGDFFRDLKIVRAGDKQEFRKGSTTATAFPERITVFVLPGPVQCAEKWPEGVPNPGRPRYREGLRFEAYWPRGPERDAVPVSVTQHGPQPWHEYGSGYQISYEVEVPAAGKTLSETLVLCILTRDNEPVRCLNAKLGIVFPVAEFTQAFKTAHPKGKLRRPVSCFGDADTAHCFVAFETSRVAGLQWEFWSYRADVGGWREIERKTFSDSPPGLPFVIPDIVVEY